MTTESPPSAREGAAARQGDADRKPEQAARAATMAVMVLAFLALVGCAGPQRGAPASQPTARLAQSPAEAKQVQAPVSLPGPGDLTPDFTVETLEHGPFTLSAQRGKAMVLFFSAST